jgi:hypothetical protein
MQNSQDSTPYAIIGIHSEIRADRCHHNFHLTSNPPAYLAPNTVGGVLHQTQDQPTLLIKHAISTPSSKRSQMTRIKQTTMSQDTLKPRTTQVQLPAYLAQLL